MEVLKRDGRKETVKLDKIVARIKKQTYGLNSDFIDPMTVAVKVIQGLYDGVPTSELDNLSAETAASMTGNHPDYAILAARIALSNLHKNTPKSFLEVTTNLHSYVNPKTGEKAGMIADDVYEFIKKNSKKLEEAIIHDRDFSYDYFGFKTLERSYLLKIDKVIAETPQQMLMRVSCGIWKDDVNEAIKTYDLMSQKFFTHATPTLFNAGTKRPQMSSCFLLQNESDSIEGMFKSFGDVAQISKNAGGIGINMNNVRGKGAYIKGTNGNSNGLIPFLKIMNEIARAIDQGGGRRKGSCAIYLEPWHSDIYEFLDLRKNQGKEEMRARDLFLALMVPDLFMLRVKEESHWTLFSPDEVPELNETYGKEFEDHFIRYENEGKGKRIQARDLWAKIIEAQIEGGTPYILFKDACNIKSNMSNIGQIRSSNLCAEILEPSGITKWQKENHPGKNINEIAVCNLASIALPMFLTITKGKDKKKKKAEFDHELLFKVAHQATINLNKVIDNNFYPVPETKFSNENHRPVGLGVQGLADVFAIMGISFESEEAKKLNKEISETIYFAALTASNELAKKHGPYNSYEGSPISKGILQYDMWGMTEQDLSGRWDFTTLKKNIKKHGVRNSLLVALMPTASCFLSDTQILTEAGIKSYQDIMNENDINWQEIEKTNNQQWLFFKQPLQVQTRFGIKASDKIFYNGLKETVKITMEDGSIFECTENHKFLVNRNNDQIWVCASDLVENDDIVTIDGNGMKITKIEKSTELKPTWDIEVQEVHEFLTHNGLVTHNTSQILGNNECFEAFTANIYKRNTLSGEFTVVNKHLVNDLVDLGLWNNDLKNKLILGEGSVQNVPEIPTELKEVYKTVWEIKQKALIDLAADRGPFVCQTQSMNIFFASVNAAKLTSALFYAWEKGLKTGMYYLRTQKDSSANKALGVDLTKAEKNVDEEIACSIDNKDACESCSG